MLLTINPNDFPTKGKCIHVVAIDDWRPDLCAITIPNLKRFAKRIGADFNLINKSKFEGYPPNYERLQVYETGKNYMWNINIDADTILHPNYIDPTTFVDPKYVATWWYMDARHYFKWNKHFERDGRNLAVADQCVVSSWLTHDVWQPLLMSYEQAKKLCLREERQVSEYCLSLNAAKYGFKHCCATQDHNSYYSIMVTGHKIQNPIELMVNKLKEWNDLEFLESVKPRLKELGHVV
jgi:hypothetical protein